MSPETIPSFSRVEITARDKAALIAASDELRSLADELEKIACQPHTDEAAAILAHHKIKATSQKLRKGENR